MKNNYVLIFLTVILIVCCSCRKQKSISIDKVFNKKNISKVEAESNKKDDCITLLKKLVTTSSIQNPFIEDIEIEIDKIEDKKMTIKLYDNSDKEHNAIGWVTVDVKNDKMFDITNDIENPIELKYDNSLWNKIIDCYFGSNSNESKNKLINKQIEDDCQDVQIEDGFKQECTYQNTTLEKVYQNTINKGEIENSEDLPLSLPLKNGAKDINKDDLLSITYIIKSKTKVNIEFLYEGGVNTLIIEQNGKNVKRTIIHSAD